MPKGSSRPTPHSRMWPRLTLTSQQGSTWFHGRQRPEGKAHPGAAPPEGSGEQYRPQTSRGPGSDPFPTRNFLILPSTSQRKMLADFGDLLHGRENSSPLVPEAVRPHLFMAPGLGGEIL